MRKIAIVVISLFFSSCQESVHSNKFKWCSSINGRNHFVHCYIRENPFVLDSLPANYIPLYSGINLEKHKWILIPVRVVDVKVTNALINDELFKTLSAVYDNLVVYSKTRYIIVPYYNEKYNKELLSAYKKKQLVYFTEGSVTDSDGDKFTDIIYSSKFFLEDIKYSNLLVRYPKRTDLD